MSVIQPVILSGGSGTRLWPTSRSAYPKQLLRLAGEKTMLQGTLLRLDGLSNVSDDCIVVSNEMHRFLVAEQMLEIGKSAQIILEPEGRNTAPAVALAALIAVESDAEKLLLVMPADHVIRDVTSFQAAVKEASKTTTGENLVTFGILPTRPETGYGYIQASPSSLAAVAIESFVEKPDAETAQQYVRGGRHFWNSGMFLFRAQAYINALEQYAPEILSACRKSLIDRAESTDFIRPDPTSFLECPSDSIDYAVMEKTDAAMMVPLDAGWSDIGSWEALHDVSPVDAAGNSVAGDVLVHDCSNTLIRAESRLVAVVGLDDVIVVETKDATLVARKSKSQDVKALVDQLKTKGRSESKLHRQVSRPWGSYDSLENADGFQVKRLVVNPGAVLSLQKHAHRAEHWVVVRGKAQITKNDDVFDLDVNESTYIAIGDVHRIANPYAEPVHIIEVQCGNYLGEDDIVRLEDNYGREGTST